MRVVSATVVGYLFWRCIVPILGVSSVLIDASFWCLPPRSDEAQAPPTIVSEIQAKEAESRKVSVAVCCLAQLRVCLCACARACAFIFAVLCSWFPPLSFSSSSSMIQRPRTDSGDSSAGEEVAVKKEVEEEDEAVATKKDKKKKKQKKQSDSEVWLCQPSAQSCVPGFVYFSISGLCY